MHRNMLRVPQIQYAVVNDENVDSPSLVISENTHMPC